MRKLHPYSLIWTWIHVHAKRLLDERLPASFGAANMVPQRWLILCCGVASLAWSSCRPATAAGDETVLFAPKPNVEVSHIRLGMVADDMELFATTVYLKRNIVTAPIPAFVTQVNLRLGQLVQKGQMLYALESKEHRALGDVKLSNDSALTAFGIVQVESPVSGVVTTFDKQQTGDYVLEGAQLCTIAESGDLAFQVNVPYEYTRWVKPGAVCTLVLGDSLRYEAVITTPLTAMNAAAQTQVMLARARVPLVLPEGLIVKVLASRAETGSHQILPKACIQTDEMMAAFWVMKMIDDSTAIKVPVTVGNRNATEVEVLAPQFLETDRIVGVGGYGLPDTAIVTIVTPE